MNVPAFTKGSKYYFQFKDQPPDDNRSDSRTREADLLLPEDPSVNNTEELKARAQELERLLEQEHQCNTALREKKELDHILKLERNYNSELRDHCDELKEMHKEQQRNTRLCDALLDNSAFEEAVKALPMKQQQQVKAHFAAAKRKSTKGMKYESEWALECLIMSMKSQHLYEHIHKNNIMVLPSRTSLHRYLKHYRSRFGLSKKVFAAVAEKTKSMDLFQHYGGLLIDKIKLSEHLSLGPDGTSEDFVDLGNFTPEIERSVM
ncbi:hypothetical protein HPB50_020281 [Hyalomma asiaticum]|uniref:Uncharacterized protein n=1 Tax=Hyalomma asiaticum TaxID=266040 RepID=A0ACB7RPV8_HYAAI|nr:hypothetical protein HPB50_020281 [Hyalomma asiaticum]